MSKVYASITETAGNTPLIKINSMADGLYGNVYAKAEFFNPLSSVKDRIGIAMIEAAEKSGFINNETVIVEPTSGNTGIGLAFVCARKGYKLILTMPETMSRERILLLKMLGAEIILTDGSKGMTGAVLKAEEIVKTANGFMPNQFANPENPKAHKQTTAVEIWNALEGDIAYFTAGAGSGGTISGVGEFLKEKNQEIKIVAVEPQESAVLSGGKAGAHKIQGIGAGFIPATLNRNVIDEILTVSSENAAIMAKRLAREEGILAGISSGANIFAALKLAARPETQGKNIVTVLCDTGERYLSASLYSDLA